MKSPSVFQRRITKYVEPVTPEELEMLDHGISKVRLSMLPMDQEATLNDNGVLMIQKESDSRVKVSGMYYTYGEVVENKLYMEGFSVSDEAGYLTYTFNEATLKGNVLTFTAVYTGKLSSGGILYPIRSVAHVTCIKQ